MVGAVSPHPESLTDRLESGTSIAMDHLERALADLGIDPRHAADGLHAEHPFPVAVRLAMLGFRVLPTRVQTKVPCIKGWPERATTDAATLARWQSRFNPNWSILTGRKNGVIVLDIDGEQGRDDLERLEGELGALPPTWRCNSGRVNGGFHVWLACPPGTDDLRNQQPIPGTKIDVRGWHGHVVVSGALHSSGTRYAWAAGCSPDDCELAECPAAWWAWLPKKESESPATRSRSPSRTGARRPSVPHDPASRLIGDGSGYGGFENPIYRNAIDYFFRAGSAAPADPVISALRRMIIAAPKDRARDVTRYLNGPDLPRVVERARNFVESVKDKNESES